MGELNRGERLQIMLTHDELRIVDTWRFSKRMPSRAAAIRELLKRGMAAEGFAEVLDGQKSKDFSAMPNDLALDGPALNGPALNGSALNGPALDDAAE
jgi:hypothetical protein